MQKINSGHLEKMQVALPERGSRLVNYSLALDEERVPLNPLLGQPIQFEYSGAIHCIHCGRASKKSFNQGFCFPCFKTLARCDSCIVSPEKCHFDRGTCREPNWAEHFCMTDHFVYLANSSGVKVGITRGSQIPTRWIDQGATQALPIMRVSSRYQSGLVEDVLRQHVADKTNWRAMLKGEAGAVDLAAVRDHLFEACGRELDALVQRFGIQAFNFIEDGESVEIDYPVLEYPTKITSFNLDQNPVAGGRLLGIKGQYLILDGGVINIRKYTAYQINFRY